MTKEVSEESRNIKRNNVEKYHRQTQNISVQNKVCNISIEGFFHSLLFNRSDYE